MTDLVDYRCHKCGVTGHRLWRGAHGAGELLCQVHSEEDQGKRMRDNCDQIGWRVPAVPTPCWTTYWGYSSVPDDGVTWWKYMPTKTALLAGEIVEPKS